MAFAMKDEQVIGAPVATVWQALNDADVLKACIPGCDSLEKVSDTEFNAVVKLKLGPVSAKFKGAVKLENIEPGQSYRIAGEGKGGIAGFAKGGADINLEAIDDNQTRLVYDVNAEIGGKIAQLGSRLIDSSAKKLAGQFFTAFNEQVSGS